MSAVREARAMSATAATALAEDLAALAPVEAPPWCGHAAALAAVCARVTRSDEVAVSVEDGSTGLRLSVDVSDDPTFAELLVRATTAGASELASDAVKLSAEPLEDSLPAPALDRLVDTLLRAAVARPDERVSRLPLLDPDDVADAVQTINGSTAPGPAASTLHGLFERRAQEA